MWDGTRIPRAELEDGRAYKIKSRNLFVGFWNEKRGGFNGIREKFGDRFIFMEVINEPLGCGTAVAYEALDLWLPEDVPNKDYLGSFCQECDKPVKSLGEGEVLRKNYQTDEMEMTKVRCIGWTHIADEDKICPREGEYMSYAKGNDAMMALLEPYDAEIVAEKQAEWENRK
jgi:hypothetical protein